MVSVNTFFRNARENKKITLQTAQRDTNIRAHLLNAIEEQDWQVFSSKIYAEGIIKNYAQYLGLSSEKMLAFFRRDYEKKEEKPFERQVKNDYFHPETRRVRVGIIVAIVTGFFLYFCFLFYAYLKPPTIVITTPTQTTFRNVDRLTIKGKTEKEASVQIRGEQIFIDKDGNFSYDFPLQKGSNKISIDVTGGNGKKTIMEKEFILE